MIDAYFVVKWIHILSSAILFGTGLGTAFQMLAAYRSGGVEAQRVVAQNVVLADWLFTAPSGVLQPVTGLVLVAMGGYSLWESWLIVAYVLYVIAAVCWVIVVVIQYRLKDLASEALTANRQLPQQYDQLMRTWFWLGWPAFISLLVIFFLMISKPSFW